MNVIWVFDLIKLFVAVFIVLGAFILVSNYFEWCIYYFYKNKEKK